MTSERATRTQPTLSGEIFVSNSGQQYGPLTLEKTRELLPTIGLKGTLIWCNGFAEWLPASEFSSQLARGESTPSLVSLAGGPPPLPSNQVAASVHQTGESRFLSKRSFITVIALATATISICSFVYSTISNSGPTGVVKGYLAATKWEDRLAYIRNPDKERALLAEHYKDWKTGTTTPYVEIQYNPKTNLSADGKRASVYVVNERGQNAFGMQIEHGWWFVLVKTEQGFLIDWEATTGHNPMTLIAYKTQRPTTPLQFRFIAKLSDYYNFEFRDARSQYYSIQLGAEDESDTIYGYVSKDSDSGKRLYEELKSGEPSAVIVKTKYLNYSQSSDHVLIDNLIQFGWIEK